MPEIPSEPSDKSSEVSDVSETMLLDDMHRLVREVGDAAGHRSVKARIVEAARRLGLSFSRARAHWYREARSVPASEWIAVQEARLALRRQRAARLRAELAALEGEHAMAAPGWIARLHVDRGPVP